MDVCIKFDDPRSNRSRDIRAAHFVMDDDNDNAGDTGHPITLGPKHIWLIATRRSLAQLQSDFGLILHSNNPRPDTHSASQGYTLLFYTHTSEMALKLSWKVLQEKPTNCGTKAADVLDKFLTRQT